jgi:hypothetical protein
MTMEVDRFTAADLPPEIGDSEIAPVLAELRRAIEGRDAARRELAQLRDDKRAAAGRDAERAAQAWKRLEAPGE